jgi:hypothetical protein
LRHRSVKLAWRIGNLLRGGSVLLVWVIGIRQSRLLAVRTPAGPGSKCACLQDVLRPLDTPLARPGNPRAAVRAGSLVWEIGIFLCGGSVLLVWVIGIRAFFCIHRMAIFAVRGTVLVWGSVSLPTRPRTAGRCLLRGAGRASPVLRRRLLPRAGSRLVDPPDRSFEPSVERVAPLVEVLEKAVLSQTRYRPPDSVVMCP